jgi:hypothetical protein
MKAALQEAEEAESEENGVKRVRDAKGREILSEAEKAQKDERDRKRAAEVIYFSFFMHCFDTHDGRRKQLREGSESKNSLITWSGSLASLQNPRQVRMMRMLPQVGGRYANSRQSKSILLSYITHILTMLLLGS